MVDISYGLTVIAGVRHAGYTCDVCGLSDIPGILWHCTECHDYDLCSGCYMSDEHDLDHAFIRRATPLSFW
jgi:E3 ubiquitin-protein ligase mind-bomb